MSKDLEPLDNNTAPACEVWALRIKKGGPTLKCTSKVR